MYTSYESIYDRVLTKFRDWDIPRMSEEEVKELLHDYLIPAISKFHVCRKDLNDRDDIIERFNCELSEIEMDIIANYMLIEYLDSTYIRTPALLKVALGSSDFKSYSSANMLEKLMAMRKAYVSENESLIARYAWLGVKESGISLSAGYEKQF